MLLHTCVPNSQTRYGRTFHINGCNESTRAFLHNTRGVEPSSDSLPPVDRYEMERCVLRVHDRDMMRGNVLRFRRDLMSRETGKDPSVSHNIQKNPMKVLPSSPSNTCGFTSVLQVFAEAALGNTVDNSGRHGFLKYGTSVLRFYSFWDDSASLYGDVQLFKLHYFLYDNTIEILTVRLRLLTLEGRPKRAGSFT